MNHWRKENAIKIYWFDSSIESSTNLQFPLKIRSKIQKANGVSQAQHSIIKIYIGKHLA